MRRGEQDDGRNRWAGGRLLLRGAIHAGRRHVLLVILVGGLLGWRWSAIGFGIDFVARMCAVGRRGDEGVVVVDGEGRLAAICGAVCAVLGFDGIVAVVVDFDDQAAVVEGRAIAVELVEHVVGQLLLAHRREELPHGRGIGQRLLGVVDAEVVGVKIDAHRGQLAAMPGQDGFLRVHWALCQLQARAQHSTARHGGAVGRECIPNCFGSGFALSSSMVGVLVTTRAMPGR